MNLLFEMAVRKFLDFGNSETMNAIISYLRLTLYTIQTAEKVRLFFIWIVPIISKKQNINHNNENQDNNKEDGSFANS